MTVRKRESKKPVKSKAPIYVGLIIFMLVAAGMGGYLLGNLTTPAAQTNVPISPTEPDATEASSDLASTSASMKRAVEIDTIYDNVYVGNLDLSGKTKNEAYELILKHLKADASAVIMLIHEEQRIPLVFEKEIESEAERLAEEAFAYARKGTLEERYKLVLALDERPYKIALSDIPKEDWILSALNKIEPLVNVPVKEAAIERKNGEFSFAKESAGKELNIPETLKSVQETVKAKKTEAAAVVTRVEPSLTLEKVSKATELLGTYKTTFTENAENRNTNIRVAAAFINDVVVNPGEVFSTNEYFKESTYENGYRMAGTIVDGELVDSLGGGVCQVSSTLYYALLLSELQIVERRNHSLKVGYVDWGFDATLSGTAIDLKFKNNTEYPITIETFVTKDTVTVNVYGYETRPLNRTIKFENALIESVQPGPDIIKDDPGRPAGERFVKKPARVGYTYQVYKLVYIDGQLTEKVTVNTSKYRSNAAEILVGTGPPASPKPSEESTESPPINIPVESFEPESTPEPEEADEPVTMPDD